MFYVKAVHSTMRVNRVVQIFSFTVTNVSVPLYNTVSLQLYLIKAKETKIESSVLQLIGVISH